MGPRPVLLRNPAPGAPIAKDRARRAYLGDAGATYFRTLAGDAFTQAVIARVRAGKIQPHVRPTDRVLEYGVGCGYNLRFVRCGERWGYDLNEAGRAGCDAAGIRFVTSVRGLAPASFDVVVCHHVLEHVPDPLETIGQIETLVRHGGTVLVFVPFETRRRYRTFVADDPNRHLFSWNVQSLGNLLSQSSLELEDIGVRPFGYERRLAHLARWGTPVYRLGLAALRAVRPEREVCARLVRPDAGVAGRLVPATTAGRAA